MYVLCIWLYDQVELDNLFLDDLICNIVFYYILKHLRC